MWCSQCQQDVPAIASPEDQKVRCTRCRYELTAYSGASEASKKILPSKTSSLESASEAVPGWAFVERPPIDPEAWQWDDDLREARRLVRSLGATLPQPGISAPSALQDDRRSGFDVAQQLARPANRVRGDTKQRKFPFLSWCMLSLGMMAFVFGGVLLAWSLLAGRHELWNLGLPFALGGQAALIIGLVLQLEGIWQSNRDATRTLEVLDEQLGELRQATSLLTTTHSSPSQSFYFHLAEGCSPHMLLADLKGQLDLLAMRLSQEK